MNMSFVDDSDDDKEIVEALEKQDTKTMSVKSTKPVLQSSFNITPQTSVDPYDSIPSSQMNYATTHSVNKENKMSQKVHVKPEPKESVKMDSKWPVKTEPFGFVKTESKDFIKPMDPTSYRHEPIETSQPFSSSDSFQEMSTDSQQTSPTTQQKRARFIQDADYLKPTNPSSSLLTKMNSSDFASQFQNTLTTNTTSQNSKSQNEFNAIFSSIGKVKSTNSFYGLPVKVKDLLKELRNITQLYDWQDELLNIMAEKYEVALNNLRDEIEDDLYTNLLYLSPTSAGKTLVAEMIILHCLLVRRVNCIFIMPFVSIVQEKVQAIAEFADALNFNVEEYAGVKGRVPPLKRPAGKGKSTLYVCTIEKAHSLVNSLIETDRLADEIGLVVADELHMIGDGSRGTIYEMILSKVNYCSEHILQLNKTVNKMS
jgi:hypothetical protein